MNFRLRNPFKKSSSPWLRVGIPSSLITLILTLVVANLGDQQKDIDYDIKGVAEVTSPEFQRTLEHMMGTPVVGGNKITAYQNGDMFACCLDVPFHDNRNATWYG